ncbi:MAG: restriction endonuclease [Verrucomicrobiae bacterium]|nr:restriction endonuclease [Verrucomicrobiae bacterium]
MDQSGSNLETYLAEIPEPRQTLPSPIQVANGKQFPPQQQILLYSSEDWEEFTTEWVHFQKQKYTSVKRLSGAGDKGIDVAAFQDELGFKGKWDCYQCKHYKTSLTPSIAYPEIAKILWHSFNKEFNPPSKYYFIAPKGCGITLTKLLLDPDKLRDNLREEWEKSCAKSITEGIDVKLEDEFLVYFEAFDFKIFSKKEPLEIIEEHRQTPYYSARFGGGLPSRPNAQLPPVAVSPHESRYIAQLFEVYSEETGRTVSSSFDLQHESLLLSHFDRAREHFYSAESLRTFARDNVPSGTFDNLKEEVLTGVIDTAHSHHESSLKRVNAVTERATSLQITDNCLISVTKVQDRKGICHQLANEDSLQWRMG